MESDSPAQSAALQTYIDEYKAAFDHTESFGLKAPVRLLARKPCVDPDATLPLILEYFDRHSPDELIGQSLTIHLDLISILWHKTRTLFELTTGFVEFRGKRFGECHDDTIRRFLDEKLVAWQRGDAPFHFWLTTHACEVLDVTFAMAVGHARTRDECARRIFYKTAAIPHSEPPTYHPKLVGEDFFYKSGAIIDFPGNR